MPRTVNRQSADLSCNPHGQKRVFQQVANRFIQLGYTPGTLRLFIHFPHHTPRLMAKHITHSAAEKM